MPWWNWMVIGLLLLGAELFIIEADFFLVFLGVAAIITGLLSLAVPSVAVWAQWLAFAALALVTMLFFRKRVYRLLRREVPDMASDLVGTPLQLPVDLPVDGTCRVEMRGSTWNAHNVGPGPIPSGAKARIVGVDGISLRVEPWN